MQLIRCLLSNFLSVCTQLTTQLHKTTANHSLHTQCRTPHAVGHGLILLMMGIMMPETCWDRKFDNKYRINCILLVPFLHLMFAMLGHKKLKMYTVCSWVAGRIGKRKLLGDKIPGLRRGYVLDCVPTMFALKFFPPICDVTLLERCAAVWIFPRFTSWQSARWSLNCEMLVVFDRVTRSARSSFPAAPADQF